MTKNLKIVALALSLAAAVSIGQIWPKLVQAQAGLWVVNSDQPSGAVQWRVFGRHGSPATIGYGTALPTVANSGAPPVNGELYIVTTAGADPLLRVRNESTTSWDTTPMLQNTNTWTVANVFNGDVTVGSDEIDAFTVNAPMTVVLHRDDFCNIGAEETDRTVESGADNAVNFMYTNQSNPYYESQIQGTQTILPHRNPADGSCGWFVEGDAAANDGVTTTFSPNTLVGVHQVTATSDEFYFEISVTIADVSAIDGDVAWGLKVPEAAGDGFDGLNTYFLYSISDNAGVATFECDVDAGGEVTDVDTITWIDGATHIVRFEIDGDGYAAYIDGAAQTLTNCNNASANDFTDLDRVVPFLQMTVGAEAVTPGFVVNYIEWGIGVI